MTPRPGLFVPSALTSSPVRFRKLESDVSNINASTTEQMDAFQSKLLELETRIINLEKPQGSAA
jgi:hypothetical protein